MDEKRSLPRSSRRVRVTFGGRLPAMTVDLHDGGFSAEMPGVFLPGAEIHGTLDDVCGAIPFKGIVIWARAGNPSLSLRSRFGVRFTELGPWGPEQLRGA